MNLAIRQERVEDYELTERVVKSAFANAEQSDKTEHKLVSRIRKSNAFISNLSLVAINKDNHQILGHVLLSKIKIINDNQVAESLALAPVSVLPEFQNKGVGRLLILEALKEAKELGFNSVVVLGHPEY
ncbi:GNAT family N-acetyltransferase, partial [Peribacillus sp. NPDC060186]